MFAENARLHNEYSMDARACERIVSSNCVSSSRREECVPVGTRYVADCTAPLRVLMTSLDSVSLSLGRGAHVDIKLPRHVYGKSLDVDIYVHKRLHTELQIYVNTHPSLSGSCA